MTSHSAVELTAARSVHTMGLRLDLMSQSEILDACLSGPPLGMVVTPNAYFFVLADRVPFVRTLLSSADLCICDSRIVKVLLRWAGVPVPLVTGSDLTAAMFNDRRIREMRVAVIGGFPGYGQTLREKFACQNLIQFMFPFQAQFTDHEIEEICSNMQGSYDITLICLGLPLQERVAAELRRTASDRFPTTLCVGASVDFLLGSKPRAPRFLQRMYLEWMFRLATEPRRLCGRYLLTSMRLFFLYFRWLRTDIADRNSIWRAIKL